jgi:hypothetical protein
LQKGHVVKVCLRGGYVCEIGVYLYIGLLSAEKRRGRGGSGLVGVVVLVVVVVVLGDVVVLFVGAHLCLECWLIYILLGIIIYLID